MLSQLSVDLSDLNLGVSVTKVQPLSVSAGAFDNHQSLFSPTRIPAASDSLFSSPTYDRAPGSEREEVTLSPHSPTLYYNVYVRVTTVLLWLNRQTTAAASRLSAVNLRLKTKSSKAQYR